MSDRLDISFAALNADPEAACAVLCAEGLELGPKAKEIDTKSAGSIAKAAAAADYKGKVKSTLEILAPAKTGIDRLIVAGVGKLANLTRAAGDRTRRRHSGGACRRARGRSRASSSTSTATTI